MHVPLRQSCVCLFLSDWGFAGRVLLDFQLDILIASISGGRIRLFGVSTKNGQVLSASLSNSNQIPVGLG